MANLSAQGGSHGKKSVDQEIPLVPFIDLLFCCVMFLLATAVWNQLGQIEAQSSEAGRGTERVIFEPEPRLALVLRISSQGFTLASSDGSSAEVGKREGAYDLAGLGTGLAAWRALDRDRRDIVVEPEDGVAYADIVRALDVVVAARFDRFSIASSALQ